MGLYLILIKGTDGWIHSFETDAGSPSEAAYAGVREWNHLWWYNHDAVIEVRTTDECWRISAREAESKPNESIRPVR
jgi:hypothetical protein